MSAYLDLKLLILLGIANGMPVVAKDILGSRLSFPLDGGVHFVDGLPMLGPSKTLRGIVLSLLVTAAVAPFVGLAWTFGLLIAALAMLGDLVSSFLKRRMRLSSSSRAIGLDQLPESVFPLLACYLPLALSVLDVAVVAVCFFASELLISKLLYKFHLRDRPY